MKEKLRFVIGFITMVCVLQSCKSDKNKYDIKELTLDNGETIIRISKDNHLKCHIEIDKNGKLKRISDEKTDVFYFQELVYQINNKKSANDSTLITLNYQDVDIIVEKFRDKLKSRTTINHVFLSPVVGHYTARLENKNWFLSENRIFDFRTALMDKEDLEYVVLREDLKNLYFEKGKVISLNFEIYSQHSVNKLLKGNFDGNFNPLNKLDTINIGKTFSLEFIPNSKYDTIRFIINSSHEEMNKSFYYELPVVANVR